MAALIETMECYPRPLRFGDMDLPAPEPAHDRCAGGYTQPGLIGGWICPCPCHHRTAQAPVSGFLEGTT